jgi:hypothetical protein
VHLLLGPELGILPLQGVNPLIQASLLLLVLQLVIHFLALLQLGLQQGHLSIKFGLFGFEGFVLDLLGLD